MTHAEKPSFHPGGCGRTLCLSCLLRQWHILHWLHQKRRAANCCSQCRTWRKVHTISSAAHSRRCLVLRQSSRGVASGTQAQIPTTRAETKISGDSSLSHGSKRVSTQFHSKRQIICEVCGRQCQKKYRSRDICSTCYHKESSAPCISCGNMKHLVSKDTGLCPRCADLAMRPTGECVRCSQFGVIYNQQDWLCKACAKKAHQRIRDKNKRIKVTCSVCGKMRASTLIGRAICHACYVEECNGRGICAGCNEHKAIFNKAEYLDDSCRHTSLRSH